MIARVRRWGNSLAVRLRKSELEGAGVEEGDLVTIRLEKVPAGGGLDLSTLPAIRDPDPKTSIRHDRYLYGAKS